MKERLSKQSKETRCFIMAAIMLFEGFKQLDEMTNIRCDMLLDVLGLTRDDMEKFPIPEYSQIVAHLKHISDFEVRGWVITNTYAPVLKSRRTDAQNAFENFCNDLRWDANEIRESMKSTEDLAELKPIGHGLNNTGAAPGSNPSTGSGCLAVIALIIVSTAFLVFTFI